jgi:hypothetical protein
MCVAEKQGLRAQQGGRRAVCLTRHAPSCPRCPPTSEQVRSLPTGVGCVVSVNGALRFTARISVDGHAYNLGTFDTAEEASEAYQKACKQHTGGETITPAKSRCDDVVRSLVAGGVLRAVRPGVAKTAAWRARSGGAQCVSRHSSFFARDPPALPRLDQPCIRRRLLLWVNWVLISSPRCGCGFLSRAPRRRSISPSCSATRAPPKSSSGPTCSATTALVQLPP